MTGLLNSIEEQGLIEMAPSSQDGRSKTLKLTAAGRRLVQALDRYVNKITSAGLSPLSPSERNTLARHLAVVADGLGAHPVPLRAGDHPVGVELRRISRVQGILGTNFMGTDFSITQTQILRVLVQQPEGVNMVELSRAMPFDASTISKAVSSLAKLKLLSKIRSKSDKRQFLLQLTARGKQVMSDLQSRMRERMKQALSKLGKRELAELCAYLDRVLSIPALAEENEEKREVRMLQSERDLKIARAVFVENIVRQKGHFDLGPDLFPKQVRAYGLYLNGNMEGTCQLRKDGQQWTCENFSVSPTAESAGLADFFLESVIRELKGAGFRGRLSYAATASGARPKVSA
jgi:DNA-binding MarR family transcriptional regulator